MLWRTSPAATELEELDVDWLAPAARTSGGLARAHRGHGLDLDARGARGRAARDGPAARFSAPSTRTPRSRRLPAARARDAQAPGGRGVPAAAGARRRELARGDAPPSWRRSGRRRPRPSTRSRRSRTLCERPARGSTSTRPTRARPSVCPESRWSLAGVRARRLARRQPAQVAVDADGLLVPLHAAAGGLPRRVHPRARVPAHDRRGRTA